VREAAEEVGGPDIDEFVMEQNPFIFNGLQVRELLRSAGVGSNWL
jgi:hypothetical protein